MRTIARPPRPTTTRPGVAALLCALSLAACDQDTAELVREINDARAGCSQAGLREGTEECVQMMQRYAEMGTEVMRTYIGAVKSLDEALQRMPPANFDTAGLGYAVRVPLDEETTLGGALAPTGPSFSRAGSDWGGDPDPRAGRWGELPQRDARWGTPPGEGWETERWAEPRGYPPPGAEMDPRAGYGPPPYPYPQDGWGEPHAPPYPHGSPYPPDPRLQGGWESPRGGTPGDPYAPYGAPAERYPYGAGHAPSREPPPSAPGRLLPPEERLRRPWLRPDGDPRARVPPAHPRLPAGGAPDTLEYRDRGHRRPREF